MSEPSNKRFLETLAKNRPVVRGPLQDRFDEKLTEVESLCRRVDVATMQLMRISKEAKEADEAAIFGDSTDGNGKSNMSHT